MTHVRRTLHMQRDGTVFVTPLDVDSIGRRAVRLAHVLVECAKVDHDVLAARAHLHIWRLYNAHKKATLEAFRRIGDTNGNT